MIKKDRNRMNDKKGKRERMKDKKGKRENEW